MKKLEQGRIKPKQGGFKHTMKKALVTAALAFSAYFMTGNALAGPIKQKSPQCSAQVVPLVGEYKEFSRSADKKKLIVFIKAKEDGKVLQVVLDSAFVDRLSKLDEEKRSLVMNANVAIAAEAANSGEKKTWECLDEKKAESSVIEAEKKLRATLNNTIEYVTQKNDIAAIAEGLYRDKYRKRLGISDYQYHYELLYDKGKNTFVWKTGKAAESINLPKNFPLKLPQQLWKLGILRLPFEGKIQAVWDYLFKNKKILYGLPLSNGRNQIEIVEQDKTANCNIANTYAAILLRQLKIPVRLRSETYFGQETAHVYAEIQVNGAWKRLDFTPKENCPELKNEMSRIQKRINPKKIQPVDMPKPGQEPKPANDDDYPVIDGSFTEETDLIDGDGQRIPGDSEKQDPINARLLKEIKRNSIAFAGIRKNPDYHSYEMNGDNFFSRENYFGIGINPATKAKSIWEVMREMRSVWGSSSTGELNKVAEINFNKGPKYTAAAFSARVSETAERQKNIVVFIYLPNSTAKKVLKQLQTNQKDKVIKGLYESLLPETSKKHKLDFSDVSVKKLK